MLNSVQIKPIKGLEHYTISEDGRVNNGKKDLKYFKNKGGYCCIKLRDVFSNIHNFTIHRLVAMHFIPNEENKEEVNHIDGNKENNYVSNLEWVTSSENKQHALENGLKEYNKPTLGLKLSGKRKAASKYFGVSRDNTRNKWVGAVVLNKKVYGRKRFNTELEAAKFYNEICDLHNLSEKPRNTFV